MPRKSIYSREMVLDAAVEVFKKEGYEQISVKKVAEYLGCSIAPVYSAYTSIEDLKKDVIKKVELTLDTCFPDEDGEEILPKVVHISEEQQGFFRRMFMALAPENEEMQKKFETLFFSALKDRKEEEQSRLHLFHIFMKAVSIIEEFQPKKLNRREILSLIARHKKYILTLKKKKLSNKKRK